MMAAAIIGSAAIGAAASVAGAKSAAKGQKAAANAQVKANRETIAFQKEIFQQQRADALPWREAGMAALKEIQIGIANGAFDPSKFDFKEDPGYAFRLAEGEKAIERAQAKRGNVLSGGAGKALLRYGQEFASDEYDRAYARAAGAKATNFNVLASMSGVGQVANQNIAQARNVLGQNVTQANTNMGNALATAYSNIGQINQSMYGNIAGAANQGIQNYMLYKYLG